MENRFAELSDKPRVKLTYLGIHEDELTREEILWALADCVAQLNGMQKDFSNYRLERMKDSIKYAREKGRE